MQREDWDAVADIFRQGIETPGVTFHTAVPAYDAWDRAHLASPRLVAEENGRVLGYCAISPVSARACYRGVAELCVYVARDARGKGAGKALLGEMCRRAKDAGLWMLESHIFAENTASVRLHESCGFRTVGVREKIGVDEKGAFHDTVLMEKRFGTWYNQGQNDQS